MDSIRKVYGYIGNRKRIPDGVEESIRLAIIKGVLSPGTRIEEKAVAEEFLISETSVREALLLLEYDGYVELKRGSGYYVSILEKSDLRKMYELACMITKGSIKCIDNSDIFVCGLLDESVAYQEELDPVLMDRKFHVSLALASRNVVYLRAMKDIYDKIEWWYRTVSDSCMSRESTSLSHLEIVRMINQHAGDDYSELNNLVDAHFQSHLKEGLK